MNQHRVVSPTLARRLAIMRQHLAGPRAPADCNGIMDVIRDLGYLQLDPMRIVERSHLLVLWSRLGQYDPVHLDTLLWGERRLFEDWAQASSIVLTKDYPVFSALKRSYATGNSLWAQRIRDWTKKNKKLRRHILTQLRSKGPLPSQHFKDKSVEDWRSTGWTSGRNIDIPNPKSNFNTPSIFHAFGKSIDRGQRRASLINTGRTW